MGHKNNLSLASFFIFNSHFGPKEGQEEKKVLFYYPYDSSAEERIKNVGLSEAIIKFSNTFADAENTCQLMRTQKTLQLFHQPEPDYWMVMCINVPHEKRKAPDGAPVSAPASTAGSEHVTEYKGDTVHEKIYRQLLLQAYRMFRLFTGRFVSHFDNDCVDYDQMPVKLMEALNDFYSKYLNALRLDRCDILDVFRSIHYLPVDRLLFLQIYTFVQIIQSRFPAIRHCILLSDERLVWSELNPDDMYAVYEYLTQHVFPHTVRSIARSPTAVSGVGGDSSGTGEHHHHYGAFVTAPAKFQNSVAIPRVHVYNSRGGDSDANVSDAHAEVAPCEVFDLVVYRSGGTSIGMFFDTSVALTDDTYHELHTFIGPQLTTIGAAIIDGTASDAQQQAHQQATADESTDSVAAGGPRYLFFNELNLRHTGTLHLNGARPPKVAAVPTEVMNLLADLYDDDANGCGATEETILKTLNDYWIVRRSSGWRHGYVVVNKSSTLMSVTEEARAIFDEHASNVFFDK